MLMTVRVNQSKLSCASKLEKLASCRFKKQLALAEFNIPLCCAPSVRRDSGRSTRLVLKQTYLV